MTNQNLPNQCTGNSRHSNRYARSPQLSAAEGIVQFARFYFLWKGKAFLMAGPQSLAFFSCRSEEAEVRR